MIGVQCITCVHYQSDSKCQFFPEGIPAGTMSGRDPHDEYRNYKTGEEWKDQTVEEML